jgi:uncharacterized zinc-type alcohol dehydrogenase-like protein
MRTDHRGYIRLGASLRRSDFQQPCEDAPLKTSAYAATDANTPLQPFSFERRELRDNDVAIDILYSGVCHTDLHMARNDWGFSMYPLVPGHEIVGRVSAVGGSVTGFKVGDNVASAPSSTVAWSASSAAATKSRCATRA